MIKSSRGARRRSKPAAQPPTLSRRHEYKSRASISHPRERSGQRLLIPAAKASVAAKSPDGCGVIYGPSEMFWGAIRFRSGELKRPFAAFNRRTIGPIFINYETIISSDAQWQICACRGMTVANEYMVLMNRLPTQPPTVSFCKAYFLWSACSGYYILFFFLNSVILIRRTVVSISSR